MTLEALGRAGGSRAWGAAGKGHREAWLPDSGEKAPCPPPPHPPGLLCQVGKIRGGQGTKDPSLSKGLALKVAPRALSQTPLQLSRATPEPPEGHLSQTSWQPRLSGWFELLPTLPLPRPLAGPSPWKSCSDQLTAGAEEAVWPAHQ